MATVYDCVIIGSGPAGLGAAFTLLDKNPGYKIAILEKNKFSSGGLRNDCKMNFTFPIGFPFDYWTAEQAFPYLERIKRKLNPPIKERIHMDTYQKRAEALDVELLDIEQAHLGTDGGLKLIQQLISELETLGADILLNTEVLEVNEDERLVNTTGGSLRFNKLIIAPGRQGFSFLQKTMRGMGIDYMDHIVDIGVRVETRLERYPIVKDYYDPKFLFPGKVRTFCTNSGAAHVVRESYKTEEGKPFASVNGHAWSDRKKQNGLVNFAMLKTITLTEPLASGQRFAEMLGLQAMLLGGGQPIMQRIGDFRMGKRSKNSNFNGDLYDFQPTLRGCTPGDIALAMPSRVLRALWKSMKKLDTIIPGILHPSTIVYYPEIKLYANKPTFIDDFFQVKPGIYMIGDGAGTSRGITAAWASGIRSAEGILS